MPEPAERRHPDNVHLSDVTTREQNHGRFGLKAKRLWPKAGGLDATQGIASGADRSKGMINE